ncbi:hypothetical protein FQN54_005512 [Arachnomyces sp. PD_36]|nr:hypothetical protein FQN54_005512 [Arachnomyces sp. PD_36]
MAAVQLNFSLRTSANVKTAHLLGSWDNYSMQLPLSNASSSKPGSWKGTFRFQGSTLELGQRYWYYYILDGYHVSHDPAVEHTVEPTTGRKLNILDVPGGGDRTSKHSYRGSTDVAKGRALSPSKIQHPKPSKPYESRHLREADFNAPPTVDELTRRFARSKMSPDSDDLSNSPPSSVGSWSSRSDSSSPSSLSSLSDHLPGTPVCRCERYGLTRKGDRVKLDCGGSRCGYGESDSSSCCSDSDSDEEYRRARGPLRREGVVVRR